MRRGVRFGNNNWTPVRARSFAEPVERLIAVTSDQLAGHLCPRPVSPWARASRLEDMARQIEMQNLMARINLPMARVEVRTDDGGHPLAVDVANLTLKHLLLLRFYADPTFARAFRYDAEDIARARRNEELARPGRAAGGDRKSVHREAGGHARIPCLDVGRNAAAGRGLGAVGGPGAAARRWLLGAPTPPKGCASACRTNSTGSGIVPVELLRHPGRGTPDPGAA